MGPPHGLIQPRRLVAPYRDSKAAGAFLGVKDLLAASDGASLTDRSFVTLVERLFGLWGYVAAWLLWRGYIGVGPEQKASPT